MNKLLRVIIFVLAILFPFGASAFSDLPESNHYYFALTYLNEEGVIQGYSDGTVRPNNSVTRAELIKILVEGVKKDGAPDGATYRNCFPDVTTEWFAPSVCYASQQGWVSGYPDGAFKPGQRINKVEALKIILNAFSIPGAAATTPVFPDTSVKAWYTPFLKAAVAKNLLEEPVASAFNPGNIRTRGEVAEMIARIKQLQYMNDPVYTDTIRAEFQTFLLVNKLRRDNGVAKQLYLNPLLTKVAREHSRDMANTGVMTHTGSDGTGASARIRGSGISGSLGTGENIGWGSGQGIWETIKAVHNMYMAEPDNECNHRTTILSKCLSFTDIGIGVSVKNDKTFFTEDFMYQH